MVYLLVLVGIIVLDRIVKVVVDTSMTFGESISVIGDFFQITYIRNTGAAFSMLQGHVLLLTLLPAVAITVALIYTFTKYKVNHPMLSIAMILVCGGGIGNLVDRIIYGYVIDMFDLKYFAVFNVADISVCVGCGLLLLYIIKSEKDK